MPWPAVAAAALAAATLLCAPSPAAGFAPRLGAGARRAPTAAASYLETLASSPDPGSEEDGAAWDEPARWALLDAAEALKISSPVTGATHVPWRSVQRRLPARAEDAAALRSKWAALREVEVDAAPPLLPLLESWEALADDAGLTGLVDGRATFLARACPGGDRSLEAQYYITETGVAYEIGGPSDKQVEAWRRPAPDAAAAAEAAADAAAGGLAAARGIGAGVLAVPVLGLAAAVAMGVLTHHLQIEVFVI